MGCKSKDKNEDPQLSVQSHKTEKYVHADNSKGVAHISRNFVRVCFLFVCFVLFCFVLFCFVLLLLLLLLLFCLFVCLFVYFVVI